jgi:hypothetical protein
MLMAFKSDGIVEGGTVVYATAIFVDLTMTSAGITDRGPISAFG